MAGGAGSSVQATGPEEGEVVEQGAFVDINVTPLVDIFLVLLVILMATSTAILEAGQGQGAGFRVQLPTGSRTDEVATGHDELVIAILKDGEIIAQGNQVSLEELSTVFKDEAAKGKDRLVLVQADEESYHRRVVQVMEAARAAGLKNLAIATRPDSE